MTSSSDLNGLCAVIIHPTAAKLPAKWIQDAFACVLFGAGTSGEPDALNQTDLQKRGTANIFVEGTDGLSIKNNRATIMRMSLNQLESAIAMFEATTEPSEEDSEPHYILAIGGQAFCQAVMHMAATGKNEQASNWGLHYLRHINNLQPGEATWMVHREHHKGVPTFVSAHLIDLFKRARGEQAA